MSKHTPGPWKFLEAHGRIDSKDYVVARITGFEIKGVYPPLEQGLADGRLIAAAPELLEALEGVLEHLPARRYFDELKRPLSALEEMMAGALKQAEAAIRKAKGE